MWMGPPNALDCPKPMSSSSTITTFGAPFGAVTLKRGGALTLRASSSVITGGCGSGIGSTVRSKTSCDQTGTAKAKKIKSCKIKREALIEPFLQSKRSGIFFDSFRSRQTWTIKSSGTARRRLTRNYTTVSPAATDLS